MWVNSADSSLQPGVEGGQATMLWVAGLIDRIVSRNPGVFDIVCCYLGPEPDGAVLVVFEVPEGCIVAWIVRVPIWVLPAWDCVHV